MLATGLEKLKSTIHPGRSSQLSEQEADRKKVGPCKNTAVLPLVADTRITVALS